jgi:hypothetical protein
MVVLHLSISAMAEVLCRLLFAMKRWPVNFALSGDFKLLGKLRYALQEMKIRIFLLVPSK